MRTAIYNKVKRVAALAFTAIMLAPAVQAQEALHLFYKNGNRETIEITPETKVEFYKKPYLDVQWMSTSPDTIHLSASSGRSAELGYVYYNVDWNISVDQDWLLVRKGNSEWGYGDGILQDYFIVYAQANATDKIREGKVTVTSAKAGLTKDIVVVQHPYMLTLESDHLWDNYEAAVITKNVEVAWKDTAYYAAVYPNHGVKLLSYPNWMTPRYLISGDDYCQFEDILKVESAQSAGNNTSTFVYFTFAQNDASTDRTGNIIFEGNGQTAVLTITQKGLTEETIVGEAAVLMDGFYQNGAAFSWGVYHSDFGFPALMFSMDSRGMDLVAEDDGYNWFSRMLDYGDLQSNIYITASRWTSMYNHILTANQGIESYGNREGESLFQFYLGQAYAVRAFNYFYLAQLYQQTYVGNEDQPCVPIITGAYQYIVEREQRPRATVREVYDYILQDLDMAEHLLSQTAVAHPGKQFVTPQVIWGLRARIYMVMNHWAEAADYAQRVIAAGVATPYTREEVSRPTFNDINHSAWLWGIDTEETDNPVVTRVVNWPSHMGSFNTNSYAEVGAWRKVNRSLYNAIPSTDVRKGWFLDGNCVSGNLNEEQVSYVASRAMPAYTQVKFAPYAGLEGTVHAQDIPLMRIEEMYLILAEAKAMMGDAAAGAAILQEFVATYRDPAYVCEATNAEEMREAVWMQRRIELWGEGHSYFDLMRMKKGVDRRGAGFQPNYVFNIPAGDAALIYPIPDREMNSNMNLVQNPEATQPVPVAE